MKKIFVLVCFALAILAIQSPTVQTQGAGPEFVAGEVIIQFQPAASAADRADARSWVAGVRRALLRRNGAGELEVARTGRSVEVAVALLRTHPAVRYAEPNWIYRHHDSSDDPYYTTGLLWGMDGDTTTPANQYGSQAGEAWAAGSTGSASVVVGVIDEGIDRNHPDLAANIWTNPFDPADGLDNDGNGYIDDVHGWDFSGNNNSIYDGAPGDNGTDSHGTHVSGTIGGIGGNTQGVAGVNWNVTIISAKFLGPSGGTLANAIKAIDYITDLKMRHGLNIVATNNSWGGGGFSQGMLDAIVRGADQDILFMAAAGNGNKFGVGQNNDSTAHYPSNYDTTAGAGYDAVIAVASITNSGARSGFSNYGKTTVDLGAPGSGIWSTTPNNTYSSFSGTSMATPHVTGAAALFASLNPTASALDIRNAILASAVATPTSSLNNITVTNGRLNIGAFAGASPNDSPTVTLESPAEGATISGTVPIHVNASDTEDGAGTLLVEWNVDGDAWKPTTYNSSTFRYEASWDSTTASEGSHTVNARATDSGGKSATNSNALTVDNEIAQTSHVGDLDGSKTSSGGSWTATVTIAVHNNGHVGVANANVSGTWSNGATGSASCTTGADGRCSIAKSSIPKRTSSVRFMVGNVSHSSLTYASTGNHDPDGDSNGSIITVTKP